MSMKTVGLKKKQNRAISVVTVPPGDDGWRWEDSRGCGFESRQLRKKPCAFMGS